MSLVGLGHILRRARRSLWENLYLNVVAVGVIAAALLLLGVFLTVQYNLSGMVESWGKDVHLSAYFHPDVPESRRFDLREHIAQDGRVADIRYVSEEDAQAWLVERVEGVEDILDELGTGALPASLEISLTDEVASPAEIAAFAEGLEGADFAVVDYGGEWVERFNAFLSLLQLLAAVLGALIVVAAVFLVVNTVNLVVYSRRDELEVQRLVGATDGTITAPFLIEGGVQGLVGGLFALAGLALVQRLVVVRLQSALDLEVAGELAALPPAVAVGLLMIGLALGTLAAWISVARFLSRVP